MGEYLPSTFQILGVTSKNHRIKENKTTALQIKSLFVASEFLSYFSSLMSTKHSIVILSKDVGAAHGYAYTCFKKYKNKSGTIAHIYNSTSQEVEIGGLLQVPGQPGLHSEFKPAWATE